MTEQKVQSRKVEGTWTLDHHLLRMSEDYLYILALNLMLLWYVSR